MRYFLTLFFAFLCVVRSQDIQIRDYTHESRAEQDARMKWWSDSRFGLFIHWGLYSIPAGEWKGTTDHGEWIRTTARIPLGEYDKFVGQFNPVKFNPTEWVRMAKDAGMKYIVITSKHHDGFCLFDSKYTDFDVMSTPFKRDIMKELADACHKEGIAICWYHSIMDWHHPDYLPRRDWENDRTTTSADFDRYVGHMKNQVKELVTKYGDIGVLWFDGEWESTWNSKYGVDLYNYVRSLRPGIIINNRVGAGRSGMEGFTKGGEFSGDFGTPEQEIPATGLPGVYWETCMTMNDHWGYNKNDGNWKSARDLIQKLADIASKGGNFLLNVGPTSEGLFPQASIDRLKQIGDWMKINGEAIYATKASPFPVLAWGRCTQKTIDGGVRLFLHVFDWPKNGKLEVPGILNTARQAYLLSDPAKKSLGVERREDAIVVSVPEQAPGPINSVIVLDVNGKIDVTNPPTIRALQNIFTESLKVSIESERENIEIRYTLDGSVPTMKSTLVVGPVTIDRTLTLTARCFRDVKPVSGSVSAVFTKVEPRASVKVEGIAPGIRYSYYEGSWSLMPDFGTLKPVKQGVIPEFDLSPTDLREDFGFEYSGYVEVRETGVYGFFTDSDDGSRLYLGDELVVDNDGLHGVQQKKGVIALAAGLHPIRVQFFQKSGGLDLKVMIQDPSGAKTSITRSMLYHQQ
jgi:alpha-L-fucosidase